MRTDERDEAYAAQKKDHAGRGRLWTLLLTAAVVAIPLVGMALTGRGDAVVAIALPLVMFVIFVAMFVLCVGAFAQGANGRGILWIVAMVIYVFGLSPLWIMLLDAIAHR